MIYLYVIMVISAGIQMEFSVDLLDHARCQLKVTPKVVLRFTRAIKESRTQEKAVGDWIKS